MSCTMSIINDYYPIVISTSAVYVFIVLGIRIFGKKEFAQLSVTDLVFVLLLSNAVQNAMVGANSTLTGGLVAATTLFIINFGFKYLIYKFPKFQKLISGSPKMLIYKGIVNEANVRGARISINELVETVREHGVHSIKDVDLAILEPDGNISVLSNDYKQRTMHMRKRRKKVLTQA
ncbi:MAG: YetF domain-containing protein [Bacteroidota bacterium]